MFQSLGFERLIRTAEIHYVKRPQRPQRPQRLQILTDSLHDGAGDRLRSEDSDVDVRTAVRYARGFRPEYEELVDMEVEGLLYSFADRNSQGVAR